MSEKRVVQGIPVEKGTGNVYADLGYRDSAGMEMKARLVAQIREIIDQRGLTQAKAAEILGLTQPKLSKVLRGQFRGVSERRLLDCLTRLGRDVRIIVQRVPRNRHTGHLTVHFA